MIPDRLWKEGAICADCGVELTQDTAWISLGQYWHSSIATCRANKKKTKETADDRCSKR